MIKSRPDTASTNQPTTPSVELAKELQAVNDDEPDTLLPFDEYETRPDNRCISWY
jgi:hypothetical protein